MNHEHITLHTQSLTAHPYFNFFWDATKKGVLLLPHCTSCKKVHWYPRTFCPFCYETKLEWRESSGDAKLYAATALTKASEPYIVAYVELAEGPLMLTNIVDASLSELKIGDALKLSFTALDSGQHLPVFKPV
jgi:uncharacterized OB-fold protein